MNTEKIENPETANQQYLMAAVQEIKKQISRAVSNSADDSNHSIQNNSSDGKNNFPLDILVSRFHLSSFERSVLLLCAGMELDTEIADMVGSPSFSLALNIFEDAHWSAIAPSGPLRYWKLIEPIESGSGKQITISPLKIDENIMFYLTGVYYSDERLGNILHPVTPEISLVPSQLITAFQISNDLAKVQNGLLPVIELRGDAKNDKLSVAAFTCFREGLALYTLPVFSLPQSTAAIDLWARLWNRQAALHNCALILDCSRTDFADRARISEVAQFIDQIQGWLIITTDQWSPEIKKSKKIYDVNKPTSLEQLTLWKTVTRTPDETASLANLVSQFNLNASAIRTIGGEIIQDAHSDNNTDSTNDLEKKLWKQCCIYTRPKADDLLQRIEPLAHWGDIVLPEDQKAILMEMVRQLKQRSKVYGSWGFASSSTRGLGISALFTGESGTGKTMASEVLANELKLDLYKVDLSQVVNKYIGETEKNLKRVFDAAEEGGAILLFDEADALFGKRSEVKDSNDRYGNIEVSYLLQRMESYRGLAILTTNMKGAMDKAFHRRIRFFVQFPFPDSALRASIWKKVFPAGTPVQDLDFAKLSRLNLPGGNIRNIAMNAAFIAAHEGTSVSMSHLSKAARNEYNKLEKPLNTLETSGLY